MCGHCGCHEVEAITELRDEHVALTDAGDRVRRAMKDADRPAALAQLTTLVSWLTRHVEREEQGIFTALREDGEFAEEVNALEGEHISLGAAVASLDPDRDDFDATVSDLLTELDVHIEREDLGIFPVSVVTLGATGWATVVHAHAAHPSFLPERNGT
jgi:hemerythrin-like domain-containing protein